MKITAKTLNLALCLALVGGAGALATTSGCAGDKNSRSTGQYIDDKSVTMRVKHALSDNQEYKFDDVNVNVFRGTVQLSGFVNTSDQKSKAEDITKGVQGVDKVINNITVKSS